MSMICSNAYLLFPGYQPFSSFWVDTFPTEGNEKRCPIPLHSPTLLFKSILFGFLS